MSYFCSPNKVDVNATYLCSVQMERKEFFLKRELELIFKTFSFFVYFVIPFRIVTCVSSWTPHLVSSHLSYLLEDSVTVLYC